MREQLYCLIIFVAIMCADFCQTQVLLEKDGNFLHQHMNPKELKRFFGTGDMSDVPAYEITHPVLSNEDGEVVSHELYGSSIPMRRSMANDEGEKRFYNFKTFGSHLHLHLKRNKVLGPQFVVETRHKDGSRKITRPKMNDHFVGNVASRPGSLVSLTAGPRGLTGMIKLPEETFYVQPLTDKLAQKHRRSQALSEKFAKTHRRSLFSHPHIVVKAKNNKKTVPCDVKDDFGVPRMERRSTSEQTNGSGIPHKYLQTVYVVDQYLELRLGQSTLEKLLPPLANVVAGIFRDSSFGPIKINYVLNKIIFLKEEQLPYASNASTNTKLNHIKHWAAGNNVDSNHFDTVTLLSRGGLGGRGDLGRLCTSSNTANVVNMAGLSSAGTIAHEVFHNIGYNHDGTKECPDKKYIMATVISAGPASFTWSNCSRDFAQSFLSSGASECLDDPPSATIKRPTESLVMLRQLPGVVYDAEKQCQYISPNAKKCPVKQNQCESLYCTLDSRKCYTNYAPPLDGTRCGVRHWCIKGVCVDDGSPIIDGDWGVWSNYSDCTKDCDIGVAYQLRTCNDPSPQNGGQNCEGSRRGNYQTCNTQECPENSVSFRQKQCLAKGNYVEYIIASDPCSLTCRSGSSVYWLGTTNDGTKCSKKKEDLDLCIEGHCREVGCDYSINTGRRFDRCKVCGGDGSSCGLNVVNYTKDHRGYGYEKADVMVTLPVHSTDVVAIKKGVTYNNIGVQSTEGEYLIVPPTWSKTVETAGTTITYIHEDNKYADRIYIPGPTQYEINLVFVWLYEKNAGVDISYYAPAEGITSKPSDFEWIVSEWSGCSRTCAGGLRTRDLICTRKEDKTEVGYEYCENSTKPSAVESCNTQPCPAEWYTTAWQTCSLPCGQGIQQRSIVCRQKLAENVWRTLSNETLCVEDKPVVLPLERHCNEINCPPEYIAGEWSECSTTCSLGLVTRQLSCQRRTSSGTTERLPDIWCQDYGSIKPSTTENCNADSPCEPPIRNEIGCFELDTTIFSDVLANFEDTLDYDNALVTIRACAKLAFHQKYRYFGLANNGECRVGADLQSKFFKPKTSERCSSFIGKTGTIYVYTLDEVPAFTSVGCYKDTGNRAMPVLYKNFRNQINWYAMERTVNQCAHVAYHSGYQYFGVQFYGECWSSPTANQTYYKHGKASNCWDGVGEEWSNFVYKFV